MGIKFGIAAAVVLGLTVTPVSFEIPSSSPTLRINTLCGATAGEQCDLEPDFICSTPATDYLDAVCKSGCGPSAH